jgi:transposase-like protein
MRVVALSLLPELRDVEEIMAECGAGVSYETIRD